MSLFNQYRQFKFKIYIMQFICILRVKTLFLQSVFFPKEDFPILYHIFEEILY